MYHQNQANQRISIASFHLEGRALQWYRWMNKTGAIDGWKDFTHALHERSGPSGFEDPIGLLAKLRQNSSVQEYQEQFEGLANRIEGLSESLEGGNSDWGTDVPANIVYCSSWTGQIT